ncbi:MAG: Type 1 glutamine amidotransferase-like domain-containing protein [Candidatus Bathyarchaeota archaeon]|nr:Type 1 glutamine amidotransferase-like domain-containing protein [Candidatus Bathyarchaeota archaeon]
MARLYFLGGENVAKQDAKEINVSAFEDAGGAPDVLVFPWARPSCDARYRRRKRLTEYFRSIGARSVEFADYSESFEETAARAACSDLIYLTGGQVSTLLSRLRKTCADKILREYSGVIVGRSAGALVLGRNCLVTNRYSGSPKVVAGLERVDFSVKVHYEHSKDDLLLDYSEKEKVYAIPQRSAIVYDNGVFSFIGKIFLFERGKKIRINAS